MKLVVSFYGMCLCVLDRREGNHAAGATVLLLNGAAPSSRAATGRTARPRLPYHHPLIFVPARHADVARTAWSPVPAPETLVDTENLMTGKHVAWSLSGLDLALGRGRGVTMFENQRAEASGRLPDPSGPADTKAYLDWRRIPDLARIAPGARVRPAFTTIGPHVLGLVRLAGGELRGATPKNAGANARPWRFSSTFEQVVTDRFEFHVEMPGTALKATGFASGRAQSIRLTGADDAVVRLVVVHEASPLSRGLAGPRRGAAATDRTLPHYTAFYEAIRGKGVEALGPPAPGAPGRRGPARPVKVIADPNCPPALI